MGAELVGEFREPHCYVTAPTGEHKSWCWRQVRLGKTVAQLSVSVGCIWQAEHLGQVAQLTDICKSHDRVLAVSPGLDCNIN